MGANLLTDSDWLVIEGQVCLVTEFTPMAGIVEAGRVSSTSSTTPYAAINFLPERPSSTITGFITNKTDFQMLWAAFRERGPVRGTRMEVRDPGPEEALAPNEEVWVVWLRSEYKFPAKLFRRFLPKLVVSVCKKGALGLLRDNTVQPELGGEARFLAMVPIVTWTPELMNR